MAIWKKVITSGSAAELASLILTTALTPGNGGLGLQFSSASGVPVGNGANSYVLIGTNGIGQFIRNQAINAILSGSFSGSFQGDGSGLTGISSAPTFTLSGSATGVSFVASTDTMVFTTSSIHGFDMSMSFSGTRKQISLVTPQDLRTSATPTFGGLNSTGPITGSKVRLTQMGGGTGNKVVVVDSNDFLVSQSIDSRVWGTSLIDGSGANTRIPFFTDADTLSSNAAFTTDGTTVTINGSTFGQDVVVAGNLTVLGTVVQLEITNLNIEDRFIYLNSGSLTGDAGIVFGSGSLGNGVAFGWDDSAARFGIQQATLLTLSSSAMVPEAYMAAVFDVDGGQSLQNYSAKNGNLRIEGGEIYIYA